MVPVTTGVEEDADIQHAREQTQRAGYPSTWMSVDKVRSNADAITTTVLEEHGTISHVKSTNASTEYPRLGCGTIIEFPFCKRRFATFRIEMLKK